MPALPGLRRPQPISRVGVGKGLSVLLSQVFVDGLLVALGLAGRAAGVARGSLLVAARRRRRVVPDVALFLVCHSVQPPSIPTCPPKRWRTGCRRRPPPCRLP